MLHVENPEDISAGRVVNDLQRGRQVLTRAPWSTEDDPVEVVIDPGTQHCSDCDELIDSFRHAPYLNVLCQQLNRYGRTFCCECLDGVNAEDADADPETDTQEVRA